MTRPLLGFGTAPILGKHGRGKSLRAIAAALDHGVCHFDTARSYGWGDAEGLLGEALKDTPRDRVVLVSKCGYLPVKRSRLLGTAKSVARVVRKVPGLGGAVQRAAASPAFQPKASYDLGLLAASLEASLAALRTDHLDVLILHNFNRATDGVEAVIEWMRGRQAAGAIRNYGVSTGVDVVETMDWLDERGLLDGTLVQAPLSAGLLATPVKYRDVATIVHSPFRSWDSSLDAANRDLGALGDTLAAQTACRAIVCSMFSPAHIATNARAMAA